MRWFQQFWFRQTLRRSAATREPWSCLKDAVQAQICGTQMPDSKSSDGRWWKCLNSELYCPVSRRRVSSMYETASNFNPEYFKRHLLWQMKPLCGFQKTAWTCGRALLLKKAAEQMLAAHVLCTDRFCLPVRSIHIHHFVHLKGPVTDVWSFSANIVSEESLLSRTPWRSRGSLGLITLKVLNRINPHKNSSQSKISF